MTTLTSTKIARNAIRTVIARPELWTNLYKNSRTVKCYVYNDDEIASIKSIVATVLPEASIRVIKRTSWYSSLIVRLPL